ncbi:hypothetical protein [Nocardia arizonensis]|uniref:hypothetical protein n=1 Tax=Nocardia arizonensis TaxID=1141647 RepID=UPI0006CF44D3|nr:hypothetical protein [Nocardia arizonensis]
MSDKVAVSLDLMQHAVTKWDQAAAHFDRAAATAFGLTISENEAGTFALALNKYKPAPGYFVDRLREGRTVFTDIARALQYAHDTYQAEDEAGAHVIRNQEGEI